MTEEPDHLQSGVLWAKEHPLNQTIGESQPDISLEC